MSRLHYYVREAALRRPGATAVVADDERVSYGGLDDRSDRLAGLLVDAGCRPGDRVVMLMPHSPMAIVALLAVYKAGAVAVPLDEASPPARLQRAIRGCEPTILLGAGDAAARIDGLHEDNAPSYRVAWLGDPEAAPAGTLAFDLDALRARSAGPSESIATWEVAHILYTSGSTGEPKGIAVTHESVRHFVDWGVRYFDITEDDRNSGHTALHFDLAFFDLFATFAAGGELHLVPREARLLPAKIVGFIREHRLTQFFSVPSVMSYLRRFDAIEQGDFPSLRRWMWCGEVLPTPSLIYAMKRLPHVAFTNLYGPTETTIASSYYTVPEVPSDESAEIPIGAACDGEALLVLDQDLRPVADGELGDLMIAGPGLSPGYWRDPERTDEVFLEHPERPGERIYRTGDLARRDADGTFFFAGRADSQIKSRGYRIELGEIELAANALDEVGEAAIVPLSTDGFEGVRICCAFTPMAEADATPATVREALRESLPAYMLPSHWLVLDAMPTNVNGKIDRPKLVEMFQAEEGGRGNATAAA